MTEEERRACEGLIQFPAASGRKKPSKEDFLRHFPAAVEQGKLSLPLLEEAYNSRNSEDLDCALVVGFSFGFGPEHVSILCRLVDEDWHQSHEDAVSALDILRTPIAIEPLFRATQWVPKYLDYDDARALAVKAIWALGNLTGAESQAKLQALMRSDDPTVRRNAEEQLERRAEREK
jgi:hypothetical protein